MHYLIILMLLSLLKVKLKSKHPNSKTIYESYDVSLCLFHKKEFEVRETEKGNKASYYTSSFDL